MKILCLHGGGTSATVRLYLTMFISQPLYRHANGADQSMCDRSSKLNLVCTPPLSDSRVAADILSCKQAPVMYELAKTEKVEFYFLNGPVEAPAATGIAEQYEGPYYRFFNNGAPHITQLTGTVESVFRQAKSPEDCGRSLRDVGLKDVGSSEACDFLQQYVVQHENAPFDGVLGFSEGGSIAASLILRQSRAKQSVSFKFAILICSLPPFRSDRVDIMLADEIEERVEVPTAHIVGRKDPIYLGSMAMYNLCNPTSASVFDHGGGHAIPWNLASTRRIAEEIRLVIKRS